MTDTTTKVREHYRAMELTDRIKSALATLHLGSELRDRLRLVPEGPAEKAWFRARFVQHISSVAQDYPDGIFAGTNDVIETITGKPPLTLEEFVSRNRAKFTV